MKSSLKQILAVGLIISCVAVSTKAQEENGLVVVLDVARVFKVNLAFDTSLKEIQAEAEGLKSNIQTQQQNLRSQAEAVTERYNPGSPEFQQEETRLETEMAKIRTQARQDEAKLLKKEAQLYHDTYLQMQQIVARLAEKHTIDLVLSFDSSQIDPQNRAEVIKGVNRGVVFQKNLDITDMVIEQMGPRTASQPIQGNN